MCRKHAACDVTQPTREGRGEPYRLLDRWRIETVIPEPPSGRRRIGTAAPLIFGRSSGTMGHGSTVQTLGGLSDLPPFPNPERASYRPKTARTRGESATARPVAKAMGVFMRSDPLIAPRDWMTGAGGGGGLSRQSLLGPSVGCGPRAEPHRLLVPCRKAAEGSRPPDSPPVLNPTGWGYIGGRFMLRSGRSTNSSERAEAMVSFRRSIMASEWYSP